MAVPRRRQDQETYEATGCAVVLLHDESDGGGMGRCAGSCGHGDGVGLWLATAASTSTASAAAGQHAHSTHACEHYCEQRKPAQPLPRTPYPAQEGQDQQSERNQRHAAARFSALLQLCRQRRLDRQRDIRSRAARGKRRWTKCCRESRGQAGGRKGHSRREGGFLRMGSSVACRWRYRLAGPSARNRFHQSSA